MTPIPELLGDKGYDSDDICRDLIDRGIEHYALQPQGFGLKLSPA